MAQRRQSRRSSGIQDRRSSSWDIRRGFCTSPLDVAYSSWSSASREIYSPSSLFSAPKRSALQRYVFSASSSSFVQIFYIYRCISSIYFFFSFRFLTCAETPEAFVSRSARATRVSILDEHDSISILSLLLRFFRYAEISRSFRSTRVRLSSATTPLRRGILSLSRGLSAKDDTSSVGFSEIGNFLRCDPTTR